MEGILDQRRKNKNFEVEKDGWLRKEGEEEIWRKWKALRQDQNLGRLRWWRRRKILSQNLPKFNFAAWRFNRKIQELGNSLYLSWYSRI